MFSVDETGDIKDTHSQDQLLKQVVPAAKEATRACGDRCQLKFSKELKAKDAHRVDVYRKAQNRKLVEIHKTMDRAKDTIMKSRQSEKRRLEKYLDDLQQEKAVSYTTLLKEVAELQGRARENRLKTVHAREGLDVLNSQLTNWNFHSHAGNVSPNTSTFQNQINKALEDAPVDEHTVLNYTNLQNKIAAKEQEYLNLREETHLLPRLVKRMSSYSFLKRYNANKGNCPRKFLSSVVPLHIERKYSAQNIGIRPPGTTERALKHRREYSEQGDTMQTKNRLMHLRTEGHRKQRGAPEKGMPCSHAEYHHYRKKEFLRKHLTKGQKQKNYWDPHVTLPERPRGAPPRGVPCSHAEYHEYQKNEYIRRRSKMQDVSQTYHKKEPPYACIDATKITRKDAKEVRQKGEALKSTVIAEVQKQNSAEVVNQSAMQTQQHGQYANKNPKCRYEKLIPTVTKSTPIERPHEYREIPLRRTKAVCSLPQIKN